MSAAPLPDLIQAYLGRVLPPDERTPRTVRLRQTGQMWMKPAGRAMAFDATEEFAVEHVAFSWRAHFPIIGPLGLEVVDGYADGAGRLCISILGIPIQTRSGPEMDLGEAARYLAELAWAPHAVVANRELEWREINASVVEVVCAVGGEKAKISWHFDSDGDLRQVTGRRLLRTGKKFTPTPWGGDFDRYKDFSGTRIPARAEVWWDLPAGRFVYWRGEVTAFDLIGAES